MELYPIADVSADLETTAIIQQYFFTVEKNSRIVNTDQQLDGIFNKYGNGGEAGQGCPDSPLCVA